MNTSLLNIELPAAERLLMGRLTLTATSKRTGEHITLRLRCKNREMRKRLITFEDAAIVTCDAPTKWDKTGDMVGYILAFGPKKNEPQANRGADPARFWLFQQVWNWIQGGELHSSLEIRLEDYCGHCGRPLSDPESIDRGFGPECFGKLTKAKHQRRQPDPQLTLPEPTEAPGEFVAGDHGENPMIDMHFQGELAFTGGEYTVGKAKAAVYGEYQEPETRTPRRCHCGQLAWYKNTFGAWKCLGCGILYDWAGEPFGQAWEERLIREREADPIYETV